MEGRHSDLGELNSVDRNVLHIGNRNLFDEFYPVSDDSNLNNNADGAKKDNSTQDSGVSLMETTSSVNSTITPHTQNSSATQTSPLRWEQKNNSTTETTSTREKGQNSQPNKVSDLNSIVELSPIETFTTTETQHKSENLNSLDSLAKKFKDSYSAEKENNSISAQNSRKPKDQNGGHLLLLEKFLNRSS